MTNLGKTLLKGHALADEGKPYYNRRGVFTSMHPDDMVEQYGRCECGQLFGPRMTQARIRQYHREHKDAFR